MKKVREGENEEGNEDSDFKVLVCPMDLPKKIANTRSIKIKIR